MSPTPIRPLGKRLLSFAVISDTHVNETEDRSPSPFRTNLLANVRARFVVEEIAARAEPVAFVVHLGDMVHPVPSQATYLPAVENYRAIMKSLTVPVHQIPGNHDIGDKCLDWMPADVITDDFLTAYRGAFGIDRFAVDHGPIRCIGINSVLMNSGLAEEAVQRTWLERELAEAKAKGQRLFLFSHYPPYVFSADEASGYDNLDDPGRAWLVELVRRSGVEACFFGHVHNYWYDEIGRTALYFQPSTTFIRHDYSELSRVAPGEEFGRNDLPKFGYGIVDVYEQGHLVHLIRTNGAGLAKGEMLKPRRLVPAPNPRVMAIPNLGVEMRHPWAEVVEVPATGGVQEFGRKLARNDYPLQALWEMGGQLLKVPDQDITTPATRQRMEMLRRLGHRFVTTSLGLPAEPFVAALASAPDLVEAVEINLSSERLDRDVAALAARKRRMGRPIYWSKLRMHEDARYDSGKFSHFVKSGLVPAELDDVAASIGKLPARAVIDGVVVRLERGVDILDMAPRLARFAANTGLGVIGAIKLADASLAKPRDDDADTARIVAEAALAAAATPGVLFLFDTFMDIDRGYHPRTGFIDRHFNPRPALHVFAAMTHVLAGAGGIVIEAVEGEGAGRRVRFTAGGVRHALVSSAGDASIAAHSAIDLMRGVFVDAVGQSQASTSPGLWLYLVSGVSRK